MLAGSFFVSVFKAHQRISPAREKQGQAQDPLLSGHSLPASPTPEAVCDQCSEGVTEKHDSGMKVKTKRSCRV